MTDIEKPDVIGATRRAETIRQGVISFAAAKEALGEAYENRDWVALGHKDWDTYCEKEFSEKRLKLTREEREQAVLAFRGAGMSIRAIGSALGLPKSSVADTLNQVSEPGHLPAEITGADGKTYRAAKTPPDAAVPEDGEEGAAATGGPAVPSEPPIEDPTSEESDPVVPVASSSALPEDSGTAPGSAPAEQEEPASSPPADERPQGETGVASPAAVPQSPMLAAALDSPEARISALRRDLHGFMADGWKVIDQIDPGELAPFLKPQVIADVATFREAIDSWLSAIGDEHRQYLRPRLVKEA